MPIARTATVASDARLAPVATVTSNSESSSRKRIAPVIKYIVGSDRG